MYKKALQQGYTYQSVRGLLTTQDLFALPLSSSNGFNLDSIAQTIAAQIKTEETASFVSASTASERNIAKLDIIKDIIKDKLAAIEDSKQQGIKSKRKQEILVLLAKKQDKKDLKKSEAALLKELEELS